MFGVFIGLLFFSLQLSFILMRTQSLKLREKKKCPVKILERLLLWLRSIEKANCVFYQFLFMHLQAVICYTLGVSYCTCPFPAMLLIPAPLCSRMSSDAKHRNCGSLAVSSRNTESTLCFNRLMPVCPTYIFGNI